MAGNVNVFTATATDNTGPAFNSVQNNIKKTKRESEKLNGSLRLMRGGFGQLGHQVQDVAVQLQMGQNPLMVLTQQGSQVASLFGPTGAVIGAVGAVAGALAGAFIPTLFESTDKVDSLEKTLKLLSETMTVDALNSTAELSKKLKELAEISEDYAKIALHSGVIAAEIELEKQSDSVGAALTDLSKKFNVGSTFIHRNSALVRLLGAQYGVGKDKAFALLAAIQGLSRGEEGAAEAFGAASQEMLASIDGTNELKQKFLEIVNPISETVVAINTLQNAVDHHKEGIEDLSSLLSGGSEEYERMAERVGKLAAQVNKVSPVDQLSQEIQANETLDALQKRQLQNALIGLRFTLQEAEKQKEIAKQKKEQAKTEEQARRQREKELQQGVSEEIKAGKDADALRSKNERKLESMRIGFLSELELIGEQEQQKKDFITGLDETFFDAAFTRQDALTFIEKDAAAKRIKIAEDEEAQKRKIQQMGMAVITDSLNFMANNLKEGTALQKTAFLATRAFAASEAIIAANRAAALVLPNIPFSNLILGMGYANAAMIMAQAVASFEGGGFTGRGARSGGVDGRGGFLSVLHPNESVIDHTKGQGQGVTIINNVDARGAGPEVDMKIRSAMEETSRKTLQTVRDLAGRGRLV